MSNQGFVLVAVAALFGGSLLFGLSPGPVLDSAAPGLLLGMMVGCFCCLAAPATPPAHAGGLVL